MRRGVRIAAVALLGLTAGAFLRSWADGDPVARNPVRGAADPVPQGATRPASLTYAETARRLSAELLKTRRAVVGVRLQPETDAFRLPVVLVSLVATPERSPEITEPIRLTAATDETGVALFEEVPYPLVYRVELDLNVILPGDHEIWVENDPQESIVRVQVPLVCTGVVTDGSGAPIPGAEVFGDVVLNEEEGESTPLPVVTTDAKGAFMQRLRFPATPIEEIRVAARADGWIPAQGTLAHRSRRHVVSTIEMVRTGTLVGRVVDEERRGLAGVTVRWVARRRVSVHEPVNNWLARRTTAGTFSVFRRGDDDRVDSFAVQATTDSSGRFVLTPPFARSTGTLLVLPVDRVPHVAQSIGHARDPEATVDFGEMVLPSVPDPVELSIVYEDGTPAESAELVFQSLEVPGEMQLNSRKIVVPRDGRVRSAFLKAGDRYRVYVSRSRVATLMSLEAALIENDGTLVIKEKDQ